MLAEERFALILNLLAEKRTATVQELCEALNASESTIRRDLTELARQGRLNKVHGGATLPDGQFLADEPTMAAKEALAVGQKRSIAQAAADLIRAEDFIYIDAGTTTLAMVRALSGPRWRPTTSPTASPTRGCWHKKLPRLRAGRSAAPPDRGHHRCGGHHGAAAVQFHQGVHRGQRRGAERRIHNARPGGGRRQGRCCPPRAGDLVSGG